MTIEVWANTCEGNEALGIIPTPDAQVVPIYRRFQTLVPRVVPFVDGDGAGVGYAKELKKSNPPPELILQLKADHTLEHLIAWILDPSEASEWEAVELILGLEKRTKDDLVTVLTKNKTNWRLHEELLVYMGANSGAKGRLSKFCDGLCEVAVTGQTSQTCWHKDEVESDESTAIWRWQPTTGGI